MATRPQSSVRAGWLDSHPAIPYVVPFAVFLVILAAVPRLGFLGIWEHPIRVGVLTAVLLIFSRRVIDLRVHHAGGAILLGVVAFLIWIGPDALFPGYRDSPLFQNALTGRITLSIPEQFRSHPLVLALRSARAIILVPIIEELFWRGWLMRWLLSPRFEQVPLGAYSRYSIVVTAILFASEHGPYWDVGLIVGILYIWWIIRTRSLGDCILAHAVTNACLSAYVLIAGKWEYWM